MNTDSTIVNADSKKFSFFVHLRVESAFTIIWNWRSRSLGISVHDRVEYATLRYLCLIAALLSPRPATLLALNEPETSLHPELMQPLAELIAVAAQFSQLWVTTHSQNLAMRIEKLSENKPVNLIRTEAGTQIEGLTPWERLI